ncbi:MAG TPA: DUF4214 domain-containing protein, partial [Candidatus Dormibacteraeota bacterium]|nr:DUF4214 domain-containing protein [Candidatus Dormibacteraeota bacterium]
DSFANSHEYHLALVDTWYVHYLGRHSDPIGQNYWATGLDQGRKDDAGIVFLVSSDEYFGHPSAF